MARIAILFGGEPAVGIRDLARSSRGHHELVFLCDPDVSGPQVRTALDRVGEVHVASREDWSDLVLGAAVQGVTTFDDALVEDLERVTLDTGLAGRSGLSAAWDKLIQRQALNDAGVSDVRVLPVSSMADLNEVRVAWGPAGVLKARRSSMSRGVVLAGPQDATSDVWRAGLQRPEQIFEQLMDMPAGGWLAPFVSVETVSVGEQRVHFACTDKLSLVRGHLETGHIMSSGRPSEHLRMIYALVTRALDALGIRDRVTHTEVGLTSSGPQVIEVNGRLGGFVHGLARRSGGLDVCRVALDVAVGQAHAADVELDDTTCVAALLVPLETNRESDVEHALRRLRDVEAVQAVERSTPVSEHFRRPVAWLQASDRVSLREGIKEAVAATGDDDVLRPLVDRAWAAEMLSG